MANPGNGQRTVNSLLMEISLHLVEPIVKAVTAVVITPGVQTVGVNSVEGMYVGAQVVVANSDGTNPTIVTITAFDPVGVTFTANFTQTYSSGNTTIQGGTFSTQQPTDPLFTQSEVIDYVARAQNEFLAKVPLIFQFFKNFPIAQGQTEQTLPATAIELERVSMLYPGTGFGDGGFGDGGFGDSTPDRYFRLYEVSQQQLSMRDPNWFFNIENPIPTKWYEDRTGAYGWGVAGVPQSNFTAQLICSVRDSEILLLTDGFLVPDIFLHYVKYRALSYIFDKAGEQRAPTQARLCQKRFDRGVMIADRYLRSFIEAPTASSGQ